MPIKLHSKRQKSKMGLFGDASHALLRSSIGVSQQHEMLAVKEVSVARKRDGHCVVFTKVASKVVFCCALFTNGFVQEVRHCLL